MLSETSPVKSKVKTVGWKRWFEKMPPLNLWIFVGAGFIIFYRFDEAIRRFFVKLSRHSLFICALKKPNVCVSGLALNENFVLWKLSWNAKYGSWEPLRGLRRSKSFLLNLEKPQTTSVRLVGDCANFVAKYLLKVPVLPLRLDFLTETCFSCFRTAAEPKNSKTKFTTAAHGSWEEFCNIF